MSEPVIMTPEELKARKRRNLWIALSVAAFMLLIFLITVAQIRAGLQ